MKRFLLFTIMAALLSSSALTLTAGCGIFTGQSPTEQIKTPHFLDSFPKHEQTFAQTPGLVKINFDFDLAERSRINIFLDDEDVTSGKTKITNDDLAMETGIKDKGEGTYTVKYRAYWPDGSSHEGQFIFYVKPETKSEYQNFTAKKSILIRLKDTKIVPQFVIIRKGTKVTWVNEDVVTHFINSDPHASHNVLKGLNSRGLSKGETFSYTFNQAGEWGYHCSAHYPQGMIAQIIVKD